jgi:predicted transcriptional regulator
MSRLLEIDISNKDYLCLVAKALSSPERIEILELLYKYSLSVQEIAQKLEMPASSVGLHIRLLENAGIIHTEKTLVNGSLYKVSHIDKHLIHFNLRASFENINETSSIAIPVGSYKDCQAKVQCGLISETGFIGTEDDPRSFYLLEHVNAQLIWMSKGFLEYKAPNVMPKYKKCKKVSLSMELCSEAIGFDENYKSDIYLSINNRECGFYRSQGDYGMRRGILTPSFWQNGLTQYGKLVTLIVDEKGVFINDEYISEMTIDELSIESSDCITFRIEVKEDSMYCGGLNLFGEKAGDYAQPIILAVEH